MATHLLSIVRIGWLPVALMLFVTKVTDDIAETPEDAAFWLGAFAQILAGVIAVFGCLRIIFGRRADQGAPGYFLFEGAEFRYLVAWLLIAAGIVAVAAGIVVAAELGSGEQDVAKLGLLVLTAAAVWAGLRLIPQPAVILNEGGLGFARAWQMTRGSFVRLGAATLLCFGPVWVLDAYAYQLVAGTWPPAPAWTWTVEGVGETIASYFDWPEQVAIAHPLATLLIDFTRYVLEYGVTAGLIGSAYTQLNASK